MEWSLPKLILVALVLLVLFGRGKLSELMGDFGKGIKSFKEGMNDEAASRPATPTTAQITPPAASPAVATEEAKQPSDTSKS